MILKSIRVRFREDQVPFIRFHNQSTGKCLVEEVIHIGRFSDDREERRIRTDGLDSLDRRITEAIEYDRSQLGLSDQEVDGRICRWGRIEYVDHVVGTACAEIVFHYLQEGLRRHVGVDVRDVEVVRCGHDAVGVGPGEVQEDGDTLFQGGANWNDVMYFYSLVILTV